MVQASWDDPGTDPGAGNRKAVPNATISSSMMNWILYTIANVDLPDLDGRLGNAETELQNARGSAASLDARLDAFLNEDGTPKKSQLEQGGAHELVGIVLQGTDASKPAAGVAGRFWLSTDTKAFYYDDGTQWVLIGKLGGLDLSNHGPRHKAGGADPILPDTIANVLTDHNAANHNSLGIDHGSLTGKGDDDHTQYVHTSIARTISAVHTFNPTTAGPPFQLGANASGQLITGLNAELLNGWTRDQIRDWNNLLNKPSTFPPSAHTHVKADITDLPNSLVSSLIADVSPTTVVGTWTTPEAATDTNDFDLSTAAANSETAAGDYYLEWDLGALYTITLVHVRYSSSFCNFNSDNRTYTVKISVSQDGATFYDIYSASGTLNQACNYPSANTIVGYGAKVRYIRFTKSNSAAFDTSSVSLKQLMVLGY